MKLNAELTLNKVHIGTSPDKKPCIKSVTLDIQDKTKSIMTGQILLDGSLFPDYMDPEEKLSGIYTVNLEITINRNPKPEKEE